MSVDARARFAEAGRAPDTGRLAEAALCVAAVAEPGVDVDAELAALEALGRGCPADLPGLRRYLFDELGFRGNTRRYNDPRNSYLHHVRTRRLGIPISLSVLAMETGRHAGVGLVGIGLPRHFLTRSASEPGAYLDAFSGRILGEEGVRALFASISGGAPLDDAWLEPVGPADILRRMLANLRHIFLPRLEETAVLWTLDLDLSLPDPVPATRLARAMSLARLCRVAEAVSALGELASEAEERGDTDAASLYRRQAAAIRAKLQ